MRPPGRDPDKPIIKQKITGVASLLEQLKQQEAENPDSSLDNTPATDTEYMKYLKRKEEREKQKQERDARQKETYDANKDPSAVGDPYKTLFISKLSKEATEEDLRREFAMYGHIENLRIVRDSNTGKSKGYAFILYERERDMKAAYKDAEGIKILDKRILVDVERGRTVKDWKPMRLGGGLGGRPKPVQPQEASFFGGPGGFRGGFRGRGNMRANDRVGGGFRGGRGGRGGRGAFGDRPPSDRPPYGGGGGGYGDRGGGGYSDRGGGDFQDRGPPRGGYGGRGRGIGYGGGAFGQDAGSFGQKRDFDSASGYQRGGFQSGGGGSTDAGWGDRDSKRPSSLIPQPGCPCKECKNALHGKSGYLRASVWRSRTWVRPSMGWTAAANFKYLNMSWFRGEQPSGQLPPPSNPARYGGNYTPVSNSGLPSRPSQPSQYGYSDKPAPLRRPAPPAALQNDVYAVVELPSTELALNNRLTFHPSAFPQGSYVVMKRDFVFTVQHDARIQPGQVGVSMIQRKWMAVAFNDRETVTPFEPRHSIGPDHLIGSATIEVSLLKETRGEPLVFDGEQMEALFRQVFDGCIFTLDQPFIFAFQGKNLLATVRGLSLVELMGMEKGGAEAKQGRMGVVVGSQTEVLFVKSEASSIRIKASSKRAPANAIIQPNFKFEDMGIGGLDTEFSNIFRRAFASRIFPPGLVEKLGIPHVKGILLYGPPGTGKTLMARQIGKMLNAREPKIVNGPEILNKFVGQSEENIRKLFADAEKEYKAKGEESGLHIIIFDEIDAICKSRGSQTSGTGVGDTVVNQLLSKMDGVDQLNNILIIGMTNRLDMIDEALLRPGRLEVHMEISLPDENGRLQILKIHTGKMLNNNILGSDVDLAELATLTKNFSGAEIGGLIKSATSYAFNRHVKVGTAAGISEDVEELQVLRQDFMMAMEEVKPAFGVSEEELERAVPNGIIHFDDYVKTIQNDGMLFIRQISKSEHTQSLSVLMHGPAGAGKTALAATLAMKSEFPFIKLISPENMVGFDEYQKVSYISKIFTDSYKSAMSVIVVDNIERILDYVPIGARFSNRVLQALMVLFTKRPPKDRRLLVIATTSNTEILHDMDLMNCFQAFIHVRAISHVSALLHVVQEMKLFTSSSELRRFQELLQTAGFFEEDKFVIGIKKLLSVIELARQDNSPADRLLGSLLAHVDSSRARLEG